MFYEEWHPEPSAERSDTFGRDGEGRNLKNDGNGDDGGGEEDEEWGRWGE